jgi:4a-hydroxytetrahydrobiopterin dehydratase
MGSSPFWPRARPDNWTPLYILSDAKAISNSLGKDIFVQISSATDLAAKTCLPCEGGVDPCPLDFARAQLSAIPAWSLSDDGRWLRRQIRFKNFVECIACVNRIAELAEAEGHHPDLHVTGYRLLGIEITTHAIGGLSENDFVLAAKIDALITAEFPTAKSHAS